MPPNISRAIIDAELPEGSLFDVKCDGGLDLFIGGMANNNKVVKDFLEDLAFLRSPLRTQILDDLEREYGISKNPALAELTRRQRLLAKKTDKSGNGTDEFIQKKLRMLSLISVVRILISVVRILILGIYQVN